MLEVRRKIQFHLRRPLPDLINFLGSKLTSALRKKRLKLVGRNFRVGPLSQIEGSEYIELGENFFAGRLFWIQAVSIYGPFRYTPKIEIGRNFNCSDCVHVSAISSVTIGDNVLFGSHVHVTDHGHGKYSGPHQNGPETAPSSRQLSPGNPVSIGSNVWLGNGVVVLPGVTIGNGTVVGANSVVSRNLPENVIAVGAPAIPIKYYDYKNRIWASY